MNAPRALLVTCLVVFAGCAGGGGPTGETPDNPQTTVSTTPTTQQPSTTPGITGDLTAGGYMELRIVENVPASVPPANASNVTIGGVVETAIDDALATNNTVTQNFTEAEGDAVTAFTDSVPESAVSGDGTHYVRVNGTVVGVRAMWT